MFLQEHNFFCYISNLEYRLFSISPLLHLPHYFKMHGSAYNTIDGELLEQLVLIEEDII